MCGITFALSEAPLPVELFSSLCNACNPRGPDYQNTHSIKVGKYTLQFHAAVLHLRGDHVAKQPFVNGDILVYVSRISLNTVVEPDTCHRMARFGTAWM